MRIQVCPDDDLMGVEYGLYGEVAAAMERNPGNASSLPRFGASSIVEYCLWSLDLVLPAKELKGRIPGGLWENLEHRRQNQMAKRVSYYKETYTEQGTRRERPSEEKRNSKLKSGLSLSAGDLRVFEGSSY